MNQLRETVLDAGPRSFVVLGVAAAALVLSVLACLLKQRRRGWTGLPGQLAVAAGSLVLLASGLAVAAVQAGRSAAVHQILGVPGAEDYGVAATVNLGIRVQFAGLIFIGAVTLFALIVVALGWRAVVVLLPLWPAATGVLLYGLRMNEGFLAAADKDPAMKTADLLRSVDAAFSIIDAARIGLLLLVALSAVTTLVTWRRGALRPASSVGLTAGALVFVSGLVAFAVTRGDAADRRPLPILPHAADASYASKVPSLSPCPPVESGPVLEFANDLVRLDSTDIQPNDLRAHFEVARNNYALLHDGRPMPFLIVIADGATPTARIVPYLQKVPGGTTILVASATSHAFLSKTLGTIARYEFCGRTFRLTDRETATPLSRYPSWSEVAAAISSNAEILEVAPW